MEVLENCEFRDCDRMAEAYCECSGDAVCFCRHHVMVHMEEGFDVKHDFKPFWIRTGERYLEGLEKMKEKVNSERENEVERAFFEYEGAMKWVEREIKEISENFDKKLLYIFEKYREKNEEIEYFLAENRIPHHYKTKIEEIIDRVSDIDIISHNEHRICEWIYYKPFWSNKIWKFHIPERRKAEVYIPLEKTLCNSQLFILNQYEIIIERYSLNRLWEVIFNVNTEQTIELPILPENVSSGTIVEHGTEYFLFLKYKNESKSFRFNLTDLNYEKISPFPEVSCEIETLSVGYCILITGAELKELYKYTPELDLYEVVLKELGKEKKQLSITSKGDIILQVENDYIYVTNENNLYDWRKVQKYDTNYSLIEISDWVEYNGDIYYLKNSSIRKIDTNFFKVESF